MARMGVRVIAYDAWEHLVRFWREVLRDPQAVASHVQRHGPAIRREQFLRFREALGAEEDPSLPALERAARFYIVNRCCFGGLMSRGSWQADRATLPIQAATSLHRACGAMPLTVEVAAFEESIPRHPNAFLFCDPPYVGHEDVYSDRQPVFDHRMLASMLLERAGPWLLTYGDHPLVRRLYGVRGVQVISLVYGGCIRGTRPAQRRDLLIVRGPRCL